LTPPEEEVPAPTVKGKEREWVKQVSFGGNMSLMTVEKRYVPCSSQG
jgi:hypothetical protein